MADGPMIAFAAAHFEGDQFFGFELTDDFGDDGGAPEIGGGFDAGAFPGEEKIGESDFGARFPIEPLDIDEVILGDAVLFAAGGENCVSHNSKKGGETAMRWSW